MLFLFFLLVAFSSAKCPLNAIESEEYDACYVHVTMVYDWNAAEQICMTRGGHLPSIHSKKQNQFLIEKVLGLNYPLGPFQSLVMIGAVQTKNTWAWTDGTPFDYTNWGDPKDSEFVPGPVSFMAINGLVPKNSGLWYDKQVSQPTGSFICQLPRCANGQSAPSLLLPSTPNLKLSYGEATNSFYYTEYAESNSEDEMTGEKKCSAIGGHLPSVRNAFEMNEVLDFMSSYTPNCLVDFGAVTDNNGENWHFTDGTNMTYTNWAPGEPKKYSQKTFSYFHSLVGQWFSEIQGADTSPYWRNFGCQYKINVNFCQ